jgi:DNA-binding beta-propeller fold protein YncE
MRAVALLLFTACGVAVLGGDAGFTDGPRIALAGVSGRIDHLAFDAERSRLFVCALGNGSVEVVDVAKGAVVKSLAKLEEPQGVAVLPAQKQIAVASGGDGKLHVYDAQSLAEVKTLDAGGDADNVRLDAKAGTLWVGCEEGLSVFDVADWKRIGVVKLVGHAESFQLESDGTRLFANVPGARHVAVVDRTKREVVATWSLDGASSNYPMALDEKSGRLYVGCRSPAEVLALDTKSGKVVAKAAIGGDCDDLFLDGARNCLYASCGEGCISVVAIGKGGALTPSPKVETTAGARTSLFVPALAKLFVAVPKRGSSGAEVRVFSASGAR